MGHIFVSYSHKDKDYVYKLQDALVSKGLEVWIDDRINYGSEWPKVIQEHVDQCDAFIVVISKNAYESRWVHNELARATRKKKPVFPLLLNGEPWITIEGTQYIDISDGSLPNEKFYENLERVISGAESLSSAEELFREATRLNLEGKVAKALQLYEQVKEIDPYFPNIDIEIDHLKTELSNGELDRDDRVIFDPIRRRDQGRFNRRTALAVILALVFVFITVYGLYNLFVAQSSSPTFSTLNTLSADAQPIDKNYAPYDVLVSGNISNASGKYLYLIVYDGHKQWIQNPLGMIPSNNFNFAGHVFLGAAVDDPAAQNTTYIVYAVVSNNSSYVEHGDFTGQTAIATSESVRLVRKDPVLAAP